MMWTYIKLAFRLRVLRAALHLFSVVGTSMEDEKLTAKERGVIWKALWELIAAYRGDKPSEVTLAHK
jgi:hypothetical protein